MKVIFFDDVPIGDVSLLIKQIGGDPHHGRYDGEENMRFDFRDHQNSIPLQGRIAISYGSVRRPYFF